MSNQRVPIEPDMTFKIAASAPAARRQENNRPGKKGRFPRGACTIAGIDVASTTQDEAVSLIDELIGRGQSRYVGVVNAAKVVAAARDEQLRRYLANADFVTADGMSVVWASRLLGAPLPERVTGIDLFERLVEYASTAGLAVYFLGAREESVRSVVQHFTVLYPSLRVAGFRNGYFPESESGAVAGEIRQSGADLLFVALGSPAQENWIAANLEPSGVRFALGVGGSFDHVSGLAPRAPGWMQHAGLEWLFRLLREPRRLWRRYLVGNSMFIWLVLKQLCSDKPAPSKPVPE